MKLLKKIITNRGYALTSDGDFFGSVRSCANFIGAPPKFAKLNTPQVSQGYYQQSIDLLANNQ